MTQEFDITFLREKIKNLSNVTGCYLWKNVQNEVIYVGKAKNLADRVKSYLLANQTDPKTKCLQNEIHDLEWIGTNTEEEALILEANLIKKYNPKFNVRLKDDKTYPFICISTDELYPMVYLSRDPKSDGKKYFGPFTDVKATRDILTWIHKTFPVRKKNIKLPTSRPQKPCLNYHIKRCIGPCRGTVPEEEYKEIVSEIVQFLEGKKDDLINKLKNKMDKYSESMEFEKAILVRDTLANIHKVLQRQAIVNPMGGDEDYIAYSQKEDDGQIAIFEIREGRLEAKKTFALNGLSTSTKKEVFRTFLSLYYLRSNRMPKVINLPIALGNDGSSFINHVHQLTGQKIKIKHPTGGKGKSLLNLAAKNAELSLTERILATKYKNETLALEELKSILKLDTIPSIIECYDISHFQGQEPVASGVMFVDGKPFKSGYRHYKIKSYDGINDPGMIHEVISRRLQRLLNEDESLPDLIIIDGGYTQLSKACEAANALGLTNLSIIGLAKQLEEIYFPGEKQPYQFEINSLVMRLIRNIRDEAHRFGLKHHRERRTKATLKTIFREIPEIGIERSKSILKLISQKQGFENITLEELKNIPQIGEKIAKKIMEKLNEL